MRKSISRCHMNEKVPSNLIPELKLFFQSTFYYFFLFLQLICIFILNSELQDVVKYIKC